VKWFGGNKILNFSILKIKLVLVLIIFTSCNSESLKDCVECEGYNINDNSFIKNKFSLFNDFDFFKLVGKKTPNKNNNLPLIKIKFNEDGNIIHLQDSLGGSFSASPLIFNYNSKTITAKLKNSDQDAYVNFIFTDSVVIALYSYKCYIERMKCESIFLSEVHILRKNLTEDVFYFQSKDLIIKDEFDFKYDYLLKYERKDSKIYTVDKSRLIVHTKSTLKTENKTSCYKCEIPFSMYWWFFYEDLMYEEINCSAPMHL
jgi:hypothetical protein